MASHASSKLPVQPLDVETAPAATAFGSAIDKGLKDGLNYVMDIIHAESLTPEQAANVMSDTIKNWGDHVNPSFLKYRKSVADDFAAIEWKDGKPGGSTLIDATGREYIDCLGGYGIFNVGHSHPAVVGAVQAQLAKAPLSSQELLDPLRSYCAALVSRVLPGDLKYCFFTNSGTESVEHSLKFAMLSTGRRHFVGLLGGFHGKTLGSLSATSKACFRGAFGGGLLPITHLPVNDLDALRRVFEASKFTGNEIAGLILEPVLGEGGIHVLTTEYMQLARKLCDDYGARLIFDEVQSGMGRTGNWWACEHAGVAPDIMACGKAFGGGVMPVGMVAGNEKSWSKYLEEPFLFTTTFGGNPLAMAAAIATIATIEKEGLVQQAAEKGEHLMGELRKLQAEYPGILRQVRGRGLLIGLEFPDDEIGYTFSRSAFGRQVLLAGTLINSRVIRVEPPLTITYEEMNEVMHRFRAVFEEMATAKPSLRDAPKGPVTLAIPGVSLNSASAAAAPSSAAPVKKAAAAKPSPSASMQGAGAATPAAAETSEEHADALHHMKGNSGAAASSASELRERTESLGSDTTGTEITGGTSVNMDNEGGEGSLSPSSLDGEDEEDEEDDEEDEEHETEAQAQERLFGCSRRGQHNVAAPVAARHGASEAAAAINGDAAVDIAVALEALEKDGKKNDIIALLSAADKPESLVINKGLHAAGAAAPAVDGGDSDDEPSAQVPSFQPVKGRRRKGAAATTVGSGSAPASPMAAATAAGNDTA